MRNETGPLKIGDDWPGYFIRGDDALALADQLLVFARVIEGKNIAVRPDEAASALRRLSENLAAVQVS